MEPADPEVAAYIARWRPSSVPPQAAAFARDVITAVAPDGQERAKNLLWAAGKLADWAIGLGLEPVPEVLLHPSVTERFTRCGPGLTGVARRTLRTNLRFIGRRAVPQLYPADLPLPRERAKAPYSPAQLDGYLAHAPAFAIRADHELAREQIAIDLAALGSGHERVAPERLEPVRVGAAKIECNAQHAVDHARRRATEDGPMVAGALHRLRRRQEIC